MLGPLEGDQEQRSLVVQNLPQKVTKQEITIHFQKIKNGGGDVDKVTMIGENIAVVTFDEREGKYDWFNLSYFILNSYKILSHAKKDTAYLRSKSHCVFGVIQRVVSTWFSHHYNYLRAATEMAPKLFTYITLEMVPNLSANILIFLHRIKIFFQLWQLKEENEELPNFVPQLI